MTKLLCHKQLWMYPLWTQRSGQVYTITCAHACLNTPTQVRERAAAEGQPVRATETEVLVASIGNDMQVGVGSGQG
jgi:hypothetical protein